MTEERKSLNQIINIRKEKLNKIISKGINPYPPLFKPTHLSGEILSNFKRSTNQSSNATECENMFTK